MSYWAYWSRNMHTYGTNPPVYYSNEKECNDASIKKRKDMAKIAIETISLLLIYTLLV
jgi:hypothetical protein